MLTDEQISAEWRKHMHKLKGWDYGGAEVMNDEGFEQAARAIESAACAERDARIAELERQLAEARNQMEAQKDEWLSWEAKRKALEKDAERWRTFLSTRPQSTHEVINQAIDDAAIRAMKKEQT